MNKKRYSLIPDQRFFRSVIAAFLLSFCAMPVYANGGPPGLPDTFYGTVTINGNPAPNDTQISATVAEGEVLTTSQNPIATVNDNYGIDGLPLLVQGYGLSGAITFYVNGHEATPSRAVTFEAGGGPTQVALSVTIPEEEAEDGVGVAVAAPTYVETTLFGVAASFRISDEGEILATIEATSQDGMLTMTIPKGTIALDKYGNPLSSLTVDVDPSPPDPPEDAYIIGLAYDFGPAGATFDPPITLEYTYDPDDIPEGVAEEDLVIAYYDEDAGKWVELDCVVDTENNTITASVPHFTTFAIIAPAPAPPVVAPPPVAPAAFSVSNLTVMPLEVQPKEAVVITVSVANTGGTEGNYTVVLKINGVKEAEKTTTIAAGSSRDVSFTVTKEEAGSYSVTVDGLSRSFTVVAPAPPPEEIPEEVPEEVPVKPPINWPLIGGIIAAVIVVGLLIFFLARRRAY